MNWMALIVVSGVSVGIVELMKKRASHWTRALVPSWRFFEEFDSVPILYCRTSRDGREFGPWFELILEPRRTAVNLLVNPNGNLALACKSLLDQFLQEIEESDDARLSELSESVSYQLIRDRVRFQLRALRNDLQESYFQFKVNSNGDVLISTVHEV